MFNNASNYYSVFTDHRLNLLLMLIEEYVNGAELQINRIEKTRKLVKKSFHNINKINWKIYRTQHLKLFCDAHYYFICIGQVSSCLKNLRDKLKNKELNRIYSDFQRTFSREIRNDLEHIAERAIGIKKQGRKTISIGDIKDFKNFANDNLTFNGKKYPVNRDALNELKGYYKKIIKVIHSDYALKSSTFVHRLKQTNMLKRITRIGQKEYQRYLHSIESAKKPNHALQ